MDEHKASEIVNSYGKSIENASKSSSSSVFACSNRFLKYSKNEIKLAIKTLVTNSYLQGQLTQSLGDQFCLSYALLGKFLNEEDALIAEKGYQLMRHMATVNDKAKIEEIQQSLEYRKFQLIQDFANCEFNKHRDEFVDFVNDMISKNNKQEES